MRGRVILGLGFMLYNSIVYGMGNSQQQETVNGKQTKCEGRVVAIRNSVIPYNTDKPLLRKTEYKSKYGTLTVDEISWPNSIAWQNFPSVSKMLYKVATTVSLGEKYKIIMNSDLEKKVEEYQRISETPELEFFLRDLRDLIRFHLIESEDDPFSKLKADCFRVISYLCYTRFSKFLIKERLLHYVTERGDSLDLIYPNVIGMTAIKMRALQYYMLGRKNPDHFSKVYKPTIENIIKYGVPHECIISWAIRHALADRDTLMLNECGAPALSFLE